MGSGGSKVVYVENPALQATVIQLQKECKEMEEARRATEKAHKQLLKEIASMKKDLDKPKEDFDRIIDCARNVVNRAAQPPDKKVILFMGQQGAGKSTLCKYLFGIDEAVPGPGDAHVTTDLILLRSPMVEDHIVDCVGKMRDVRGMMRVIACAYNRGWNPVGLIVAHAGRNGLYNDLAFYLQASKINTIYFEPMGFWNILNRNNDAALALDCSVRSDYDYELPKVNYIHPGNTQVEHCSITENLVASLESLTWNSSPNSNEYEGIVNTMTYYMAKAIADRANFRGSDHDFIDNEM